MTVPMPVRTNPAASEKGSVRGASMIGSSVMKMFESIRNVSERSEGTVLIFAELGEKSSPRAHGVGDRPLRPARRISSAQIPISHLFTTIRDVAGRAVGSD